MPVIGRLAATVAFGAVVVLSAAVAAQNPLRPTKKPLPGSPASPSPRADPVGEAATADLPRLRLGALLPLTGASAWYGEEMRHGMELAAADLNPPPRSTQPTTRSLTTPGTSGPDQAAPPEAGGAQEGVPNPALRVSLEILDVQPLNVRDAAADFMRLAATGTTVVFTASATPTLAIHPLAASRDILVVHQGLPGDRFPASSQTLLHTRPSVGSRAAGLAAAAWEHGIRRLAVLAGGDEFGRAVRATLSAGWRERGASLAYEESLLLEAPDLPVRLARVARLRPEAVCLAFRGQDLGELARRLREAGYAGLLLALDDDPAALLTAGPALSDTMLLVDRFVPEPETRGARFAKAYEAKFGRSPSRFAANAYDAVSILAEATRVALQEGRGIPSGARLRETLLARRAFPSVYGGQIVVRDDGTLERPLALFRVERGREVFVRYISPSGRPGAPRSLAPSSGRQSAAG